MSKYPFPIPTPWGEADTWTTITPGIVRVCTPSHGGYHLAPHMQDKVPGYMRHPGDSFGAQRAAGWYEEDVDWSIVALVFPQFFPARVPAGHAGAVGCGAREGGCPCVLNRHSRPGGRSWLGRPSTKRIPPLPS
jgi:hypothetical protein